MDGRQESGIDPKWTPTPNGPQMDGNKTSMTAIMPSGTPSQTTAWIYGVTTSGGSTVNSNDVLAKVEYPDPSTGAASTSAANDVSYTANALGETLTAADQNGTTHTFARNTLGRETADIVTTLGSGVDGSVRRRGFTYSPLGSVYQATTVNTPWISTQIRGWRYFGML
jgi:hypothetical protein